MNHSELSEDNSSHSELGYCYQDLFDSAPDGYLVTDAKGIIHQANPAAARLLAISSDKIRGMAIPDFVIEKDQWKTRLAMLTQQQSVEDAQPWVVHIKPKGAIPFWAAITTAISHASTGEITSFRWLIRDISESKQIEDAQLFLLKSGWSALGEDFFASLARYLSEVLWMDYVCIDRLEGDLLSAQTVAIYYDGKNEPNESYRLQDTPCGTVVGKTICCFTENVRGLFPRDKALQEMKAESYVGTTLWSSQGLPIGLIAIIGRKPLKNPKLAETILQLVAIRAAGELERRRAEEVLKVSEETFNRTFHSHAAAMALASLDDNTIIDVNDRWLELSGYDREEVIGKYADRLGVWKNLNYRVSMINDLLNGVIVRDREFQFVKKSGEEWTALSSSQIINVHGKQVLLTSSVDITERKKAEIALMEADQAKDEFLAVLSHELQTPLTSMLGWSAEAIRVGTPEMMARAMEIVHRNALRQKRLIDDILDMSRLIHHKIYLQLEVSDLWMQVKMAVENVQQNATEQKISLTLAPLEMPLPIQVDINRMQQCITNLLYNSLKFTPEGGTISVTCSIEGKRGVLRICDTGRGISAEALPMIFDIFRQVKRDEQVGGLGLGLAIARGIIKLHGGGITAESAGENLGSTFTIYLPLLAV